ncbi:unnamed protein product [Rotaria sp. Silwood1]|nr:unnamed protein product [Rotaria sp. Silwood1]CAF3376363.1 unnamed protein product [Rotaria sp. Silwood1]CAF4557693.1 unnamed protein product [Rotaria sp. Silwood1]CAF4875898.1 unnamed protein product [Rotaria sp. Silwood1]
MSFDSVSFNKYSKSAIGTETRGKTAQNRLRRVDNFIMMYCPYLIMSKEHFYVDLGFGHTPITTLESAKRFRRYNAQLPIIGVEIDNKRVRKAQQFADDITYFRQGGFNLPLQVNTNTGHTETVNLIRAFNVLRQYDLELDCRTSHVFMCNYLNINGILIEGTSDPFGRIWVANIIRKQTDHSLLIEALVFSTNFRDGFNIVSFQQVLPKNFIHRMTGANEMIYKFFEDWKISYEQVGKSMKNIYGIGLRQQFSVTGKHLATEYGYNIVTGKKFLKNGFLIWLLKPGSKGVDIDQITYRTTNHKKK